MSELHFNYTGSVQQVELEKGIYKIECWGASGGGAHQSSYAGKAGAGGYSVGRLVLNAKTNLYICVGGQGTSPITSGTGGWNGGGNSQSKVNQNIDPACTGGGATDVRINSTSITSRIIVAGGGGGGGMDGEPGGYGGGEIGGDGYNHLNSGGTQTSGYALGQGQHGSYSNSYGGPGAGGGYYGGRTHPTSWVGAAGGSGYVNKSIVSMANTIGGNEVMPSKDGTSSMVGNMGHGFVKITNLSKVTFPFTGSLQTFVVEIPGRYSFKAWGAAGGCGGPRSLAGERYYQFRHGSGCTYNGQTHKSSNRDTCSQCGHTCNGPGTLVDTSKNYGSVGGLGGYISGEVYLRKGDIVYVQVGGKGSAAHEANGGAGYNGGGAGTSDRTSIGYGGGGATDFRIGGTSLQDRVLVAGGGGGADDYDGGLLGASNDGSGGNGSGTDIGGEPRNNGTLQTGFGARNDGRFNLGTGQSATGYYDKAGAGGGYYGGNTTNSNSGGAGGGNGYYSPLMLSISTRDGIRDGDGIASIELLKDEKNYQYYAIELNGEKYIPSKRFYDEENDKFIPLSDEELFRPNYDREDFINNLIDLFKEKDFYGKTFSPISRFLGGKILKITCVISSTNDIFDSLTEKIEIDLNIDMNMYSKTSVEIKDFITSPGQSLPFYLSTNTSSKFKIAINYRGALLGEYFKDIQYEEIRAFGIEQKNLESYDIPFKESKVFFKFIDNIDSKGDYLKRLIIKQKTDERMTRLSSKDLNIKYDGIRDIVNIEMLQDYKEILINKNNYIEESKSDTLDEF